MFREYREKLKLTQEQLAELCNMSWRQIERIENGKAIPTLESFNK